MAGQESAQATGARPRRPVRHRLSVGHWLMIGAGLLGAALTFAIVRSADRTVPVAVAAHDLTPGQRVDAGDFTLTRLRADRAFVAALIGPADIAGLDGKVLVRRIPKGHLVERVDFDERRRGATARSMSLPVERARAVGGAVEPGDVVDLVAASDGGAWYVATGVAVLAVDGGSSAPLGAGDDRLIVTLAVDERTALEIVRAVKIGDVTLVRATGAPEVRDATPIAAEAIVPVSVPGETAGG
jgi:Flp pilus assembly protein CpaB